jgi:hypothetical protein
LTTTRHRTCDPFLPTASVHNAARPARCYGRPRSRASVAGGLARARAGAILARLNPIIRGWAAFYRGAVSSLVFSRLDTYVWKLTYKWAKHTPPEQVKDLGDAPLFRQVQQVQERPVGRR